MRHVYVPSETHLSAANTLSNSCVFVDMCVSICACVAYHHTTLRLHTNCVPPCTDCIFAHRLHTHCSLALHLFHAHDTRYTDHTLTTVYELYVQWCRCDLHARQRCECVRIWACACMHANTDTEAEQAVENGLAWQRPQSGLSPIWITRVFLKRIVLASELMTVLEEHLRMLAHNSQVNAYYIVFTHVHTHAHIHVGTHVFTQVHTSVFSHLPLRLSVRMSVHMSTQTSMQYAYVYTNLYTHVCIHVCPQAYPHSRHMLVNASIQYPCPRARARRQLQDPLGPLEMVGP